MTASLTDRYVHAVARSLPESRRDDVERELRATIADDIDARVDAGSSPSDAERDALASLGDPAALVAGYLDRPLHLIGPAYYLTWVRLLRLLLVIVLPIATAGVVVGQVIAGTPPGGIVGSAIGIAITLAVHLAFWTAFVFWLIERTAQRSAQRAAMPTWTLDQLPTPPVKGVPSLGEAITVASFVALAIAAIIGQQFVSNFTDAAGAPIPVLRPELWSWALPLVIAILLAEVGHAFWLVAARRWTLAHVVVNIVLAAASATLMVFLITGPGFYNPEWFAALEQVAPSGATPVLDIVDLITVLTVVGVGLWDVVDGAWKWFRGRSA